MRARSNDLGAVPDTGGVTFRVLSDSAERIDLCLFEDETTESRRIPMAAAGGVHGARVAGLKPGALYGFRAHGPFVTERGMRFDPAKLLADPWALGLSRAFTYHPDLCLHPEAERDTAALVPKSVVTDLPPPLPARPPLFRPGGLIYELNVRAFTMRHPDIPPAERGTVAALAHPAIIEHLTRIGVGAVELMPITAWIDERHLHPLGLHNAWGYNPVCYMAPDPRICPGGIGELRGAVEALRAAGIGTLLDVVFNHTGESDAFGPTLSLRGLDAPAYFRHAKNGELINDAGTGNTLQCDNPTTRRLVLDSLRHFVTQAGVDGFRFDLAPILGRSIEGFDRNAELFREIEADDRLRDRVMIAEPWDIGPGGYQLGNFPETFLEWNDRARDRLRRFWRGDGHMLGELATTLAGSSDSFTGMKTRGVTFIAAHDGFTLADLTAYAHRHNQANGENNRDGHGENHSWNNGAEGPTDDATILAARTRDIRALLATLFATRGSIMLTAGDEFGRSQQGNNNAYAQDNVITWLNWENRDRTLEDHVAWLSALRHSHPELADPAFLTGEINKASVADVEWLAPDGRTMEAGDWESGSGPGLAMLLGRSDGGRLAVLFNRTLEPLQFAFPARDGWDWPDDPASVQVPPRSVTFTAETRRAATS